MELVLIVKNGQYARVSELLASGGLLYNEFIPLEGNTELQGLSLKASIAFVQLSWKALCCSDVQFQYEVAYAIDPDCSSDHVSLPNACTVYSQRTVNDTINVLGLMPNRCYVFGVRAYELVSGIFGYYSIINGATISGSKLSIFDINEIIVFYMYNRYQEFIC